VPEDVVLAKATHGREFPAVAGRGRVMGTQFHPERSGAVGLSMLANFLALATGREPIQTAGAAAAADRSARGSGAAVAAGGGEERSR